MKYASPNADCLTYLSLLESLVSLLGIEASDMFTKESHIGSTPIFDSEGITSRERGILGHQTILFGANEASTDGIQHTHWKLYNGMNSRFFASIAADKGHNKMAGQFLDTLIMNELSFDRTYNINPKPEFKNPTDIWPTNEETVMPKGVSTLPRNNIPAKNTFWSIIDEQAYWTIHHQDHNFSCFKNDQIIYRFKLPARTWNQISGVIQLVLDDHDKTIFHILRDIEPMRIPDPNDILEFTNDSRYLLFVNTKRGSDDKILRDPTISSTMEINIEYIQETDTTRENGLVSPCKP